MQLLWERDSWKNYWRQTVSDRGKRRESRQRKAENEAEISEELSGRLSRRDRRDNNDELDSEDSNPELPETIERDHAARLGGQAPVRESSSRGSSTGAALQKAGHKNSYSSTQPKIKQALRGVKKSAESTGHAFKSICKWFFHASVFAHTVESEYFQPMINVVANTGPNFKASSRHDIYGRGLEGEVEELHQWVESFKHIWMERGCTIICDGWIGTTKKSVINFFVYYTEGTIFV
ncbi:hypothetical protein Taro_015295 [Colocasia esculenta]|uniref:DUF659 domain-containing protein n=1 Tax=Colocasia esculenta TaxID=4460 RepID=A0A843ULY6_COLES|nr:hypothetical protein [Colocasia esculenta]